MHMKKVKILFKKENYSLVDNSSVRYCNFLKIIFIYEKVTK